MTRWVTWTLRRVISVLFRLRPSVSHIPAAGHLLSVVEFRIWVLFLVRQAAESCVTCPVVWWCVNIVVVSCGCDMLVQYDHHVATFVCCPVRRSSWILPIICIASLLMRWFIRYSCWLTLHYHTHSLLNVLLPSSLSSEVIYGILIQSCFVRDAMLYYAPCWKSSCECWTTAICWYCDYEFHLYIDCLLLACYWVVILLKSNNLVNDFEFYGDLPYVAVVENCIKLCILSMYLHYIVLCVNLSHVCS